MRTVVSTAVNVYKRTSVNAVGDITVRGASSANVRFRALTAAVVMESTVVLAGSTFEVNSAKSKSPDCGSGVSYQMLYAYLFFFTKIR